MADEYIEQVVRKGDSGSDLLAALCAETLDKRYVEIVGGKLALKVPAGHDVVVFQAAGNPDLERGMHAASLVERLVQRCELLRAVPLGMANVIDSRTGDFSILEELAKGMVSAANRHGISIVNGENAILGDRVQTANMVGTLVSMVSEESLPLGRNAAKSPQGKFSYVVFSPEDRLVFINSDGVGTKTEFYERARMFDRAILDSLAMKLDDAARVFGDVKAVFDVVETRGRLPFDSLKSKAKELALSLGIEYVIEEHSVGERINGYWDSPSFHISGSAVSLLNPRGESLHPSAGETIVAINGGMNPRSNGISDKRRILKEVYGEDWHLASRAFGLFEYVTAPSVILYPVFMDLLRSGLATSVYHMSGGALEGKLARPFAKHGLFAKMHRLFNPPPEEIFFHDHSHATIQECYAKCPMGNDGYVTTKNPIDAIRAINRYGLRGKVVGVLEKAEDGKAGVEVHLNDGMVMYFSGK